MKAFLDTSVLVPVFYGDHEHHHASFSLFVTLTKHSGYCGAHTLAEVYSTLTGMPGRYRVTGDQAMLFIGSVRDQKHFRQLGPAVTERLKTPAAM